MHLLEIETLAEFDEVQASPGSLRGWHLQSLDLTDRGPALAAADVAGAVFLGCRFAAGDGPGSEDDVRRRGGLVFPTVPAVPFDPYRARLYSPDDLYAGLANGYDTTPDAMAYAWSLGERSLDKTLAAALHDHAIDDALEEYIEDRTLVGVMGGHAVLRDSEDYADAARLGRDLGRVFTVATGGGPGAMEAAISAPGWPMLLPTRSPRRSPCSAPYPTSPAISEPGLRVRSRCASGGRAGRNPWGSRPGTTATSRRTRWHR